MQQQAGSGRVRKEITMTTSQHPKTSHPSDKDLRINPGIGQSKGLNRHTGDDDILGDATEEGDVGPEHGAVPGGRRGRLVHGRSMPTGRVRQDGCDRSDRRTQGASTWCTS